MKDKKAIKPKNKTKPVMLYFRDSEIKLFDYLLKEYPHKYRFIIDIVRDCIDFAYSDVFKDIGLKSPLERT